MDFIGNLVASFWDTDGVGLFENVGMHMNNF